MIENKISGPSHDCMWTWLLVFVALSILLILAYLAYCLYRLSSSVMDQPETTRKRKRRTIEKRRKRKTTTEHISSKVVSEASSDNQLLNGLSSNWEKLKQKLGKSGSSSEKRKHSYPETISTPKKADKVPKFKPSSDSVNRLSVTGHTILQLLLCTDYDLINSQIISKPGSKKTEEIGSYLGVDCEFVGVGPDGSRSALARVSVVNYFGHVILDEYVRPKERVTDWRTWVSGVAPKHMKNAITFEEAQKKVSELFKNRIVVGHAIHNDLHALMISHPRKLIRDTSLHKPFRQLVKKGAPGLKMLTSELLNIDIQTGEHSSVEDAQATMLIFRLNKRQFDMIIYQKSRKAE